MNAADQNQKSCPSLEELSAWHDGAGEPGLRAHVEACAACQQLLVTFRRVDAAMRVAAQPSPDLAERIKARCRALPQREPLFLVLWNQPLLRWAAACAVVAVVLLLVHQKMTTATVAAPMAGAETAPTPAAAPALVANSTPPPVPAVPPAQDEGAGTTAARSAGTAVAGSNPIRASKIVRAAADPAPAGNADMRQALLVPARVRHVWVVKDLESAKKQVMASLPADASLTVTTAEDGTVSIQALVTDRVLQSLVDKLAGAGMSLVSPTAPQPDRGKDLVVTGRMVRYDVDLVPAP